VPPARCCWHKAGFRVSDVDSFFTAALRCDLNRSLPLADLGATDPQAEDRYAEADAQSAFDYLEFTAPHQVFTAITLTSVYNTDNPLSPC
jgi:hypothetical protein